MSDESNERYANTEPADETTEVEAHRRRAMATEDQSDDQSDAGGSDDFEAHVRKAQ